MGPSILGKLFSPRPATLAGRRLYASAAAQARRPAFYLQGGVKDSPEGRFELYSLHVTLLLHRLKDQGPRAAETGQALFDAYLRSLDDALRDLGVGDLSVGKKMRKLGEALYGRVKAYDAVLGPPVDQAGLEALIARTLPDGASADQVAALAAYVAATAQALAAAPLETLLEDDPTWIAFAHEDA